MDENLVNNELQSILNDFKDHVTYVKWQPKDKDGNIIYGQTEAIKHYIENYGKIIHSFSLFNLNGHVIYIKEIENQPYKIITAIRSKNAYKIVSGEMLPTFIELSLIVIFLIMVKIIYSVLIFKNRK